MQRSVSFISESPMRSGSQTDGSMYVAPIREQVRDWEGFSQTQEQLKSYARAAQEAAAAQSARGMARSPATAAGGGGGGGLPSGSTVTMVRREGSPSVATLREANARGEEAVRSGVVQTSRSMVPPSTWTSRSPAAAAAGGGATAGVYTNPYDPRARAVAETDRPQQLVDHQTYLAWRRAEYARRLEAEARGEYYESQPKPYSPSFTQALSREIADPRFRSMDFQGRSKQILAPQVVGTPEEIAWLQPPQIPPPVNWNGFWDLCPGHEVILQVMNVSGANPDNSPSLTEHFMYPELLSCVQRLQYGTYLIHYTPREPPHERYFYIKPLPLANKAQYCPFLCWSLHKNAHSAVDAIPLCNVIWVTQGCHTKNMKKYQTSEDYINGPFVGKKKAHCLTHGCMTVWVYDGKKTRSIDVLATDPLVFTMWMKLLDDMAQLNAALDISGSVRTMQKYIEGLKAKGDIDKVKETAEEPGFFSSLFRRRDADE